MRRHRRPSHAAIAMNAYHLWLEAGQPAGNDEEYVRQAREVLARKARHARRPDPEAGDEPIPIDAR